MSCETCGVDHHGHKDVHVFTYHNEASINANLKDPISMEPIFDGKELPCKHVFSSHVILEWFKGHDTCPVCKQPATAENLMPLASLIVRSMLDELEVCFQVFLFAYLTFFLAQTFTITGAVPVRVLQALRARQSCGTFP